MSYEIADLWLDCIKPANSAEEMLRNLRNCSQEKAVMMLLRDLLEIVGEGNIYMGLKEFAYHPYGLGSSHISFHFTNEDGIDVGYETPPDA